MADDDTMRVVVIKEGEGMVAQAFGGVIVDGDGTVKVGDRLVSANEVNPALAMTLSNIEDGLKIVITDPDERDDCLNRLLNDKEGLANRQELFGMGLDEVRAQLAANIS